MGPCLLPLLLALLPAAAFAAPVSFVVNDAMIKDHLLPGARIAVAPAPDALPTREGTTDSTGRWQVDLAPGTWWVSYGSPGYIPIPASRLEVPEAGTTVTTALTLMMEAGDAPSRRRVQIVLTWGSGWSAVRDADAHLVCACDGDEISFSHMEHHRTGHDVVLDVDDMAWGGPETITLYDPPPGHYEYFVQSFSGGPATLGGSEALVRVLVGDELVGEYAVPPDVGSGEWLPFKELVVDASLRPTVVPFTEPQRRQGADQRPGDCGPVGCDGVCCSLFLLVQLAAMGAWLLKRSGR